MYKLPTNRLNCFAGFSPVCAFRHSRKLCHQQQQRCAIMLQASTCSMQCSIMCPLTAWRMCQALHATFVTLYNSATLSLSPTSRSCIEQCVAMNQVAQSSLQMASSCSLTGLSWHWAAVQAPLAFLVSRNMLWASMTSMMQPG